MLKDITGIKLAGGGFRNPVELRLFDPLDGNKIKLPNLDKPEKHNTKILPYCARNCS